MTAIVGIKCKDGIVIGADSSATFASGNFRTIEQPTDKIDIIGDRVIVAGTGQIGLGQRFCEIVRQAWTEKKFQQSPIEIAKLLTQNSIQDFASTQARMGEYGALVAYPSENRFHLCEFSVADFQPELKTEKLWYVSMGSGQPITDPFLAFIREVFWDNGLPNTHEAVFAATWTLDQAIKFNPGGVNGPIQIAVLRQGEKGIEARMLDDTELYQHFQNIDEAKKRLRDYRNNHQPSTQAETSEIPKPQDKSSSGEATPEFPHPGETTPAATP
jgi:20S proteasome alpha/beta subunit